jgi:hypothetical protein
MLSDFSVGLEILVALVTVLASQSIFHLVKTNNSSVGEIVRSQLSDELTKSIIGLLGLLFVLWGLSTIIRKRGWQNENEPNAFWGVVLPDVLSFWVLYAFYNEFNFIYQ